MTKIWLRTRYHKEFFLGEFEEKFFNLRFSYYKKKEIAPHEYLVDVPLDVFYFYFKSK